MSATDTAASMGRRAAERFIATGVGARNPFDDSDTAPAAILALATAYAVAYVDALPRPVSPPAAS